MLYKKQKHLLGEILQATDFPLAISIRCQTNIIRLCATITGRKGHSSLSSFARGYGNSMTTSNNLTLVDSNNKNLSPIGSLTFDRATKEIKGSSTIFSFDISTEGIQGFSRSRKININENDTCSANQNQNSCDYTERDP